MEGNEVSWLDLCMSEIRLARTSSENDVWYSPRYIYAYVIYICACSANIWVTISVVFCLLWNMNWRNIGKLVFNNLKDLVNIYTSIWSSVLKQNYISDICTHYHTSVTVFVFLMWLSLVCFGKLSTLLCFCQQGWGKNCLKF